MTLEDELVEISRESKKTKDLRNAEDIERQQKNKEEQLQRDIEKIIKDLPALLRNAASKGDCALKVMRLSERSHLNVKWDELNNEIEIHGIRKVLLEPIIPLIDYLENEKLAVTIKEYNRSDPGQGRSWTERFIVVSW